MSFLVQLTLLLCCFAIGRYTAGQHPTFKAFLALVLLIGVATAASLEASEGKPIRFESVRSPVLSLSVVKARPTPPVARPAAPNVIAPVPIVAQPLPAVAAPQCHFYWNPTTRSWIRFCR